MKIYNFFLVPKNILAITIFPFIFFQYTKEEILKRHSFKEFQELLNHENIHIEQQIKLMLIGLILYIPLSIITLKFLFLIPILFYIIYILNWIVNFFKHNNGSAYDNICFEKEANFFEKVERYPLKDKWWKLFSWIKHL